MAGLRRIAVALLVGGLFAGFLTGALPGGAAQAQDRRQNAPGAFDYYVLSLSWSPSYCEAAREQTDNRNNDLQCGARPYSFVVHGLWPQYDRGFPEYCQRTPARLDRNIVSSMLDLMPSPGLVFHQWRRHGTCSGLPPRGYFETVRRARAAVKIPEQYLDLPRPLTVAPAEVEAAFLKANPGLPAEGIAVLCHRSRLSEVRVCVDRDLQFRACPEVDRRTCPIRQVVMPPVRGGPGGTSGAGR